MSVQSVRKPPATTPPGWQDRHLPIDTVFDVASANAMAGLESFNKHLYRPNTFLHKWWARRCGSTFRLILKHLVEDPGRRDYYQPGGLEGMVILDPMMGGATTLHEGIRLGANLIGADIDPVPILQARASLSAIPLEELELSFERLIQTLGARLLSLFTTTSPCCGTPAPMLYLLYGQMRECSCGTAVFIDSTTLRREADGSRVRLCDRCGEILVEKAGQGPAPCACQGGGAGFFLQEKGTRSCPRCGGRYRELTTVPYYRRYVPLAVVTRCTTHGIGFKTPDRSDLALLERADRARQELPFPSSDFQVRPGPKSADLVNHGITSYLDLFSSRQLLYLASAVDALSESDGLARLNLALLVSTSLEFNSMLCGFKAPTTGRARRAEIRRPGAVRHAFSHHAYSFPYTALENNPLYPERSSGTLQSLFHARIRRARQWAAQPVERKLCQGRVSGRVTIPGEVDSGTEVHSPAELSRGAKRFLLIQGSSAALALPAGSVDHIVTDPPYFDNVQYSDLSAFFRVWLRRLLPDQANWEIDLAQSAVGAQANGVVRYECLLTAIFAECRRVLKDDGRLVFTFHHGKLAAWAALTGALRAAGFVLVNRYVVHSENPASVHIANLRALRHDAILVLAAASPAGPDSPAAAEGHRWTLPDRIDASSSEAFIAGCAVALGWMLETRLDRPAIDHLWLALRSQ